MTHVTAGCVCGDSISVKSDRLQTANGILSAFQEVHSGPGHGACGVDTARRARARAKRESREGART